MSPSDAGRRGLSGAALFLAVACQSPPSGERSPFAAADSLRDERRWARAHPHYRQLRDSFATTQDTAGWWRAQAWWAYTLMRLGRTDSSAAALGEAFALAGADSSRQGWTYWLRCALSSRLGRFEAALADCRRARDLAEGSGDGELLARVHFQQGTLYSRRALYRLSVAETERALELERRHGRSRQQLAGVLNSMGIEYAAVGRLRDATDAYEEGLAVARGVSDTSTAGVIISNLAALRAYTGRLDQAIQLMQEALGYAAAVGDSASIVYARNSLADYHRKAGNRAEARAQLTASLAVGAAQVPAVYRLIAFVNLGLIEMAEGQATEAQATLERALPLAAAGGFGLERFQIHSALARLALARRDLASARRQTGMARVIADSIASPDVEVRALELEGRLREAEGRGDAPGRFLEAIDLLESWRGRLALGDLALGIVEPRWSVYEGAVRTLLQAGDAEAAFTVAERARARLLLEIMAERQAEGQGQVAAALKQRLRERYQERSGTTDSLRRGLDAEIAALTDSLASLEAVDLARDPGAAARYPRPASLSRVRAALLADGNPAILSMFWGDSAVYAWWVTRDAILARRLGPADSLATTLDFLRLSMARPGADSLWVTAAARAWEQLIAPFNAALPSRIYAVTDGPAAGIPIEVLLPRRSAPPLGASAEIVYGPSASVLAALADAPPRRWERAMLAVGNPRVSGGPPASSRRAPRVDPVIELPHAEAEARAISDLYAADGADLLLGRRATVERWLERRPGRYRYLHFAAHARADDREPDGSRLFLANGALDPPAIRRLTLSADLVTLSACETALGRQVRGEGVMGLAQAFLAAGARSTLVTLWPVSDRSAAEFMAEFYREVRAGAAPAAALAAVRRRRVEAGGPAAHPSSWAPFVLLGAAVR
jgi:CHAT domain-containing protein